MASTSESSSDRSTTGHDFMMMVIIIVIMMRIIIILIYSKDFRGTFTGFVSRPSYQIVGGVIANVPRIDKGVLVIRLPIGFESGGNFHHDVHDIVLAGLSRGNVGGLGGFGHLHMYFLRNPLRKEDYVGQNDKEFSYRTPNSYTVQNDIDLRFPT